MVFSKIDGELSIYKENQVFLFGASSSGVWVKEILENFGISITAFIDNNIEKQGKQFSDKEIISVSALHAMLRKNEKYIIQISSVYEKEIESQLEDEKLNYISYSEFAGRMLRLSEYLLLKQNPALRFYTYEVEWKREVAGIELQMREYLRKKWMEDKKTDTVNFMLSGPKTGNNTIACSVKSGDLMLRTHSYTVIKEFLERYSVNLKMNIIIGVRDVVSQNLSFLFEALDDGYLNDIDLVWKNDVQTVFYDCILSNRHGGMLQFIREKLNTNFLIQDFFDQQLKYYFNIDIYRYPFDKEKGYCVYEFDDIRIMIYQLEKLDNLEYEISKFLGIKQFTMERHNVGERKWYSKYYKSICKEIVLGQEYLDNCYSGKYMQHFYSEEDIARFKSKWKCEKLS
jgi:Putative capsular polysaccharide synthesis protein.